MHPVVVGMIVFACTLGGALVGMWLRTMLPEHHLTGESRDTVKLGVGLIATLTALVLGLVTASAKTSFDGMDTEVKHAAVDILSLDRLLARYGPETRDIRGGLQHAVALRIEMIWPQSSTRPATLDPSGAASRAEGLADRIRGLAPRDDSQRSLQSRALELAEAMLKTRWMATAGHGALIPLPFLAVLSFWLAVTFASLGLLTSRNGTVFVVFVVCALSVGSAAFLILELDGPFDGLLKVSADPLRYAHSHLNQ